MLPLFRDSYRQRRRISAKESGKHGHLLPPAPFFSTLSTPRPALLVLFLRSAHQPAELNKIYLARRSAPRNSGEFRRAGGASGLATTEQRGKEGKRGGGGASFGFRSKRRSACKLQPRRLPRAVTLLNYQATRKILVSKFTDFSRGILDQILS